MHPIIDSDGDDFVTSLPLLELFVTVMPVFENRLSIMNKSYPVEKPVVANRCYHFFFFWDRGADAQIIK